MEIWDAGRGWTTGVDGTDLVARNAADYEAPPPHTPPPHAPRTLSPVRTFGSDAALLSEQTLPRTALAL